MTNHAGTSRMRQPKRPPERQPVSARRQQRIDSANAHYRRLTGQRIGWFRQQGWSDEKIAGVMRIPVERVAAEPAE